MIGACFYGSFQPWIPSLLCQSQNSRHFPVPFVHSKRGARRSLFYAASTGARAEVRSEGNVAVQSDGSIAIKKKASEISADLKGTSIFLVGISSNHKLALGRILADSLRYYYFDSDGLVEEAAGGKDAALSLLERDEEGYLASETEVLRQLSSMGRLVVSAGNGAVKSATNLALIRHGISIWIDVPLDIVADDLINKELQLPASDMAKFTAFPDDHSLALEHALAELASLYDNARIGYSTADATISLQGVAARLGRDDLSSVTPEDLCIEALKKIEKLVKVKKMMQEAARPF